MIPSHATTFTPDEEKEVRLLLREHNPRSVRKAKASLYAMPASAAADLLAKIAEGAVTISQARRKAIVILVLSSGAVVVGLSLLHNPVVPLIGAAIAINLAVGSLYDGTRAARRAALLLAERDDYRAIAPLAKLWDTQSHETPAALHEGEELERALTRLLTALTANKYENLADDAVRDLLNRAFPPLPQRAKPMLSDFSETRADLLLAALRYLAHATPGKESPLTRELVARIAAYPVESFASNRNLVHETASLCLDPAHRATPLAVTAPVAQTAGIR